MTNKSKGTVSKGVAYAIIGGLILFVVSAFIFMFAIVNNGGFAAISISNPLSGLFAGNYSNRIVGTWRSGLSAYVFESGGRYTIIEGSIDLHGLIEDVLEGRTSPSRAPTVTQVSGTYTVSGNTLTLSRGNRTYTISFDGRNTMILEGANGRTRTLTRE